MVIVIFVAVSLKLTVLLPTSGTSFLKRPLC